MLGTDTKIDETFSTGRDRPENRDELARMQRKYPPDLPATHTWDYRWEDPSSEALAKNRYLMPTLVYGPRELTLAEIAAKTKDFETLGHGELRWLFDRNHVKALPLDAKAPKLDEVQGLREAIRAHVKTNPETAAPNPRAVTATKPTSSQAAVALPSDIAGMDRAAIETAAATMGVHDEWKKLSGKSIQMQREWLASKRNAAKGAELVTA